jgi:hypothetical protein
MRGVNDQSRLIKLTEKNLCISHLALPQRFHNAAHSPWKKSAALPRVTRGNTCTDVKYPLCPGAMNCGAAGHPGQRAGALCPQLLDHRWRYSCLVMPVRLSQGRPIRRHADSCHNKQQSRRNQFITPAMVTVPRATLCVVVLGLITVALANAAPTAQAPAPAEACNTTQVQQERDAVRESSV